MTSVPLLSARRCTELDLHTCNGDMGNRFRRRIAGEAGWQRENHAEEVDPPPLYWEKLPRKSSTAGQRTIWNDAGDIKEVSVWGSKVANPGTAATRPDFVATGVCAPQHWHQIIATHLESFDSGAFVHKRWRMEPMMIFFKGLGTFTR